MVTEAGAGTGDTVICRQVAEQASNMGLRVVVLSVHSPEPSGWYSLSNADHPLDHQWKDKREVCYVSLPAFFGALPTCGFKPADWVADFDLMIVDAPEAETQLQTYLAQRSDAVILLVDSRRQSLRNIVRLSHSIAENGSRLLGVILSGHSSPIPAWLDRWRDQPA